MSDDSSSRPGGGTPVAPAVSPSVEVLISAPEWRAEGLAGIAEAAAVAALDANRWREHGFAFDGTELSIELADDGRVAALNAAFRGRQGPTNVLSFPAYPATDLPSVLRGRAGGVPLPLGDIVVAYGVAAAEASRAGRPLAHHLAHLVVHGTLHCLGYDHETDVEAAEMEALEAGILARLGIPDPYHDPVCTEAVR